MRQISTIALHVQPGIPRSPARVSIALTGGAPDEHGVLHLTADCLTLDELEGQINGLQDELDLLRAEARRVFTRESGHA